jgi:FkbM family methyltransferase
MNTLRRIGRFVFGRLLPPGIPLPVVRGPLRGTWMILGSAAGEGKGASVFFDLTEPEQTAAFVQHLKHGQVFYDIGANVGYYTLLASRIVGRNGLVIAVEPVIRNVIYLQKHLSLNKSRNVRILAAACSNALSTTTFFLGMNPALGHLSGDQTRAGSVSLHPGVTIVPTLTVDSIMLSSQAKPDAIKIDVEGAEFDVLAGAQNTLAEHRPIIFLSVHSVELRDQCTNLLQEHGYQVKGLGQKDGNEWLAVPAERKR